jgi:hypothetical protein
MHVMVVTIGILGAHSRKAAERSSPQPVRLPLSLPLILAKYCPLVVGRAAEVVVSSTAELPVYEILISLQRRSNFISSWRLASGRVVCNAEYQRCGEGQYNHVTTHDIILLRLHLPGKPRSSLQRPW